MSFRTLCVQSCHRIGPGLDAEPCELIEIKVYGPPNIPIQTNPKQCWWGFLTTETNSFTSREHRNLGRKVQFLLLGQPKVGDQARKNAFVRPDMQLVY
jgi:hypothetical protein